MEIIQLTFVSLFCLLPIFSDDSLIIKDFSVSKFCGAELICIQLWACEVA